MTCSWTYASKDICQVLNSLPKLKQKWHLLPTEFGETELMTPARKKSTEPYLTKPLYIPPSSGALSLHMLQSNNLASEVLAAKVCTLICQTGISKKYIEIPKRWIETWRFVKQHTWSGDNVCCLVILDVNFADYQHGYLFSSSISRILGHSWALESLS